MNSKWTWSRLGDIAKTSSGGTPNRSHKEFYGGDIPWVKSGELGDRVIFESSETITEAGLMGSSAKLFPKGTLCIALYGATVGKLGILGIDATTNQAVCGIQLPVNLSTKFAYRFLEYQREEIVKLAKGGAQPNISQDIVRNILIPVPTPDEQSVIVDEIDKQFSRLDAGIAALKRAQSNLKRYRASVLKAACEGRLVIHAGHVQGATGQDMLDSLVSKRKLSKAKPEELTNIDTTNLPELPKGWTWCRLSQISNVVRGGSPRPAGDPKYFGGNVPWITVGPITADNTPYLRSTPTGLTEAGKLHSRFVDLGTLLLTNSGATLGVPKITLISGCLNDGVAALLDVHEPLKLFLLYYLSSKTEELRQVNQGAAQPNLNTTIIKNLPVPLPPETELYKISAEIERRVSVADAIEASLNQQLIRASRLRQAILASIFSSGDDHGL